MVPDFCKIETFTFQTIIRKVDVVSKFLKVFLCELCRYYYNLEEEEVSQQNTLFSLGCLLAEFVITRGDPDDTTESNSNKFASFSPNVFMPDQEWSTRDGHWNDIETPTKSHLDQAKNRLKDAYRQCGATGNDSFRKLVGNLLSPTPKKRSTATALLDEYTDNGLFSPENLERGRALLRRLQ